MELAIIVLFALFLEIVFMVIIDYIEIKNIEEESVD